MGIARFFMEFPAGCYVLLDPVAEGVPVQDLTAASFRCENWLAHRLSRRHRAV